MAKKLVFTTQMTRTWNTRATTGSIFLLLGVCVGVQREALGCARLCACTKMTARQPFGVLPFFLFRFACASGGSSEGIVPARRVRALRAPRAAVYGLCVVRLVRVGLGWVSVGLRIARVYSIGAPAPL